jgi:hypothetical protein
MERDSPAKLSINYDSILELSVAFSAEQFKAFGILTDHYSSGLCHLKSGSI